MDPSVLRHQAIVCLVVRHDVAHAFEGWVDRRAAIILRRLGHDGKKKISTIVNHR